MILFRSLAALGLLTLSMTAASATATLTCEIDDSVVEFNLQAAVGSSSIVSSLQGRLDLKKRRPAFGFDMNSENLLQQWINGPDLRLRFHNADDDPVATELVIIATRVNELDFRGRYMLSVSQAGKAQKNSGRVKCGLG
jgi:hypothetical protein